MSETGEKLSPAVSAGLNQVAAIREASVSRRDNLPPTMRRGLDELAERREWAAELRDRLSMITSSTREKSNYPQYWGAIGAAAIGFLVVTSTLNPNSSIGNVEQVQAPEREELKELKDFLNKKTNLLSEDKKLAQFISERSNPGNPLFEYHVSEDTDTNIGGKFTPANPDLEHHTFRFSKDDNPRLSDFGVSLTVNKVTGNVEKASINLYVGEDTFFDPSKHAENNGFLEQSQSEAIVKRVLKNRQENGVFYPGNASTPNRSTMNAEVHEDGNWETVSVNGDGGVDYSFRPDPNIP